MRNIQRFQCARRIRKYSLLRITSYLRYFWFLLRFFFSLFIRILVCFFFSFDFNCIRVVYDFIFGVLLFILLSNFFLVQYVATLRSSFTEKIYNNVSEVKLKCEIKTATDNCSIPEITRADCRSTNMSIWRVCALRRNLLCLMTIMQRDELQRKTAKKQSTNNRSISKKKWK